MPEGEQIIEQFDRLASNAGAGVRPVISLCWCNHPEDSHIKEEPRGYGGTLNGHCYHCVCKKYIEKD